MVSHQYADPANRGKLRALAGLGATVAAAVPARWVLPGGGGARDTAYGTLVAPRIVAPNHDHWFSFRLDLDVDGPENSFLRGDFKTVTTPDQPRKSFWVLDSHVLETERAARLNHDEAPMMWTVVNPHSRNAVGNPVGYEIEPLGSSEEVLLTPEDHPRKRAGFIDHTLWVTPYRPDEIYAAGTYVNQSKGGDGLPA